MCITIKCSIVVTLLLVQSICSTEIKNSKLLFSEREIVDTLVRTWSPLVWLAPNEQFLPGNVKTFLTHVHAEREKNGEKKIKDIGDNLGKYSHYYQNDAFEDLIYYEEAPEQTEGVAAVQNNRKRRNFEKDTSLEHIFELPIDDASENWYLVSNDNLDDLMKNKSSFIYGENPAAVPVYAVVSMCAAAGDGGEVIKNEIDTNSKFKYKKNPYIPLIKTPDVNYYGPTGGAKLQMTDKQQISEKQQVRELQARDKQQVIEKQKLTDKQQLQDSVKLELDEVESGSVDDSLNFVRRRRSHGHNATALNETFPQTNATKPPIELWKPVASHQNVVIYTKDEQIVVPSVPQAVAVDDMKIIHDKSIVGNIPHFHVSYWMFYPFSQGKTVCTLNLGPLGPIPIPLVPVWNICLGTKKEFGSHVGDWEHMSLFFRGRMEPDEMYVSAHDAGAYYTFDRLTGTFEFKSQESRKGIFQKPNFPKTVITSENHPVLFSAEGSHGLWATPGKHRFVRVPRLYDINGFGEPWQTWKNVEVIYDDVRGKRSMGGSNPNWMKYRGKWGNPKSKCHPLRKLGLHVCEQTDGPTGIPKKTAHFACTR